MLKITFLVLFLAPLSVFSQQKSSPAPFAKEITEQKLRQHLYIIAGKDYEGRETATAGQRKAAAYIESYFKQLGLNPGNGSAYQLFYPVYRDSIQTASLSINDDSFQRFTDFDVNSASNLNWDLAASQIVFAGYGLSDSLQDDYKGLEVQGKVVLVLNGYPPGMLRSEVKNKRFNPFAKPDAAQKHGAVAMLMVQDDFPHPVDSAPGRMYVSRYQRTIHPLTFHISHKIAEAIMGGDFADAKNPKLIGKSYPARTALSFVKLPETLQSSDVLGYLPGTDLKDQLLIISAHYDHLGKKDSVFFPGADDDGSGTVSILEIADAFTKAKAAGKGPRRSILFLANSGEEKGLWGSAYYAEHPTYPLDHTTADLNIDMIGRKDPGRTKGDSNNYVYIVGDDKLSSELHPISIAANKASSKLEFDYKFNDPNDPLRIYYRSDHYNFAKKGVPVIFYFDGIHADYHKPSDTPDKINYDLMAKRAKLVFFTAWEMANRDAMVKRDKVLPPE